MDTLLWVTVVVIALLLLIGAALVTIRRRRSGDILASRPVGRDGGSS
jgi:hypothetical protein